MHIIAAKAVAFKQVMQPSFLDYQKRVLANAKALAEGFINRGVAVVSGGTDTHLLLLDLRTTGISGQELQERLDKVNITCNKNTIPFDTRLGDIRNREYCRRCRSSKHFSRRRG